MSTTAITCELLTVNTRSSDLQPTGGGSGNGIVATTAADGFVISPPSGLQFDERLIIAIGWDGSGGTLTFKGGDRFPAQRADLGDLIITGAASDVRFIDIETSRFLQNDGTILAIPSTTGCAVTALMQSKAP